MTGFSWKPPTPSESFLSSCLKDFFLLTGGNAGTRTLTVDVYEQGFALADLGAGSAVAVIIFALLSLFMILYFRFLPRGEEESNA